jgi:hypothetical protein
MAQTKDDENDVNREFIPEQTSTRNVSDGPRQFAKEFRDELEFAANVDPAAEDLEKQRQSSQHAAGITNRPLEEEEHEQEKLPERNHRKAVSRG